MRTLGLGLALTVSSPVLAAQNGNGQSYRASIEGAPGALQGKLAPLSELKKAQRDYPTAAALRRAARRDLDAFLDALRAAGYYAGKANFTLTPGDGETPPSVTFTIEPGIRFEVTEYEILYQDEAEGRPATFQDANIKTTGASDGAALRDQQESFLAYLWNNGFPSAEIVDRRAIANFETGETSAVFVFRSGPKAQFGAPQVRGVEKTDPDFIKRMKTWEVGEEYERAKLTSYYDRINRTGLFAAVNVEPGPLDEDGMAPIIVELEERRQRTIGAGVSYSTAEGPGGRIFFEHRNIFGHGERGRVEFRGSEIEQSANVGLTRPMPRIGGDAFANLAFSNETTDAFRARSLELSGGLSKRWLNDKLETRGGLALETSNVRNGGVEERTYFVSAPLSVLWNSEDDLLEPRKGFRASGSLTPYVGSDSFTQSEVAARGRVHIGSNDVVTLAARTALSATFGSSFNDLPLNKRFYAGGGGSVRGFSFQEAGPLDADNDPIGGRSKIEGAIEARVKVIRNLQLAGFVDAGSVSTKAVPDFTDEYFIGYGGGVRYLTPIGPIRADIAFPLDKRDTDSDFQIYIALGQPF
ncbi:MAG: BamA/TamA family outer membrane protein [Pseudomonadota bacterium]